MKQIKPLLLLLFLFVFFSCEVENTNEKTTPKCSIDTATINSISLRNFYMGFSSWQYGPELQHKEETYRFIDHNADIYLEQLDNKIPWSALINNTDFPQEFTNEINGRVSRRISGHKLLVSVSLLNTDRSNLAEDFDGSIPFYNSLADQTIEDAYFTYLEYLINKLNPDYLVFAIEVNELKIHSEEKWLQYKDLADKLRSRLKTSYANLPVSESITLHNFYLADVSNPEAMVTELSNYVNTKHDFAAISFYPFFKGLHSKNDFQQPFDFLHSHINIPIAFVETTHLAENLSIESYQLEISASPCEQKDYLEVLAKNAYQQEYAFIIWWAYRDFDLLWETFPEAYKDLGKLWRDTGLLSEDGTERIAYASWQAIFRR